MTRLCGICGESCRKAQIVYAKRAGKLERLLCCRRCAREAIVLVLPEALACIECGTRAPVLCLGCAKNARERAEAAERRKAQLERARKRGAQRLTPLRDHIWPKGKPVES